MLVAGCAARPGTPKTVTLELTGPGTATEVAYSYPAGADVAHGLEHGSALPWSKTLTVGAGRTVAVGLTAPGGPAADGRYACKVTIDGRAEPVAASIYGAENRGERHNGLDLARYLNLDLTGVDKMGQLDNSGQIVLCSVTVE